MRFTLTLSAFVLAAASSAAAQDAEGWRLHGSVQASGDVHSKDEAPPVGALVAPAPSSTLAVSLDAGRDMPKGGFQATLLGVLWDPASADDRGAYVGGRARGFRDLSPAWRSTLTEDARLQRHAGSASTDFQRNELELAFDRRSAGGSEIGVHLSDRRRSVGAQPDLGFARQSLSLAATVAASRTTRLRLEGGGQHYSGRTASGERLFAAAEVAHVHRRGVVGVRVEWYSSELGAGGGASTAASAPVLNPTPTPPPTTAPTEAEPGRYLPSDVDPPPPGAASAGPELAVDALLVQPFEEEDDWDFGQSRVGAQAFASRDLGHGWQVSGYVHLQHREGRNLLSPAPLDVREDRLWIRAALRRRLTARWSVLIQGSRLESRVTAPIPDFSRTLGSLGLQFSF
jgi:hypothetical protein